MICTANEAIDSNAAGEEVVHEAVLEGAELIPFSQLDRVPVGQLITNAGYGYGCRSQIDHSGGPLSRKGRDVLGCHDLGLVGRR